MTTENTTPTQAWRALSAEFTNWTIWTSDAGRWWATRPGRLSPERIAKGAHITVEADDLTAMADVLAEQDQIREETP